MRETGEHLCRIIHVSDIMDTNNLIIDIRIKIYNSAVFILKEMASINNPCT
jgi:hypothetical protein